MWAGESIQSATQGDVAIDLQLSVREGDTDREVLFAKTEASQPAVASHKRERETE